MRVVIGIVCSALMFIGGAAAGCAASAQAGVAALLARSAEAWNHGDLDDFMRAYENSPETVYMNATAVIRGYAAIRAHYAGRYAPGRMGQLSVSDLAVRPLGLRYAVATARWHLARTKSAGGNVSGLFSLVLHQDAAGWHIITDHTP